MLDNTRPHTFRRHSHKLPRIRRFAARTGSAELLACLMLDFIPNTNGFDCSVKISVAETVRENPNTEEIKSCGHSQS